MMTTTPFAHPRRAAGVVLVALLLVAFAAVVISRPIVDPRRPASAANAPSTTPGATWETSPERILAGGDWSGGMTRAELLTISEAVVVLTPLRLVDEYWSPGTLQQLPISRWAVRVDRVVRGDVKPGEELILGLAGGHVALGRTLSIESGRLQGSLQPTGGGSADLVMIDTLPFPRPGQSELAFLSRTTDGAGASWWSFAVPHSRFTIGPGGRLRSPLPGEPARIPVVAELTALPLDDALQLLAR